MHGAQFPAHLIQTGLNWDHLVLPESTLSQLTEIRDWILHGQKLLDEWGLRDRIAAGFTSLLHGPSGTGKTTAACLLGKHCGCEVFKVDLSLMVSKYIGETEKNLARIFDAAENRGWILFFDEADALFGKRTRVSDSHDRYANQEVSFLLQRIEEFSGVVILASNLKSNIDPAFTRRLQSIIPFPMPQGAERLRIWRNALSARCALEHGLSLEEIAEKHEISGGTIVNVVRFASLRSISRGSHLIRREDIEEGLRREQLKEGRNL
jgi:SpoVK/Ycf46/Vps4 family AAA+-type ATPase